ncbi:MAG: ABC transporter substrate-binding protein [Elusimicrobia bacterium]|nr:ABC transporter substrate-binding protein [Elusimicrobiota bacterium]
MRYLALKSSFRVLLTLLIGFSPAAAAGVVKNPETLTYLNLSAVDTLDPIWASDSPSRLVILNIYDTLFQFDGASMQKMIPLLGMKVPSKENGLISADGKTYTIPIRHGVQFQDGTLLSAEDVRYSLLRTLLIEPFSAPSSLLRESLLGYASTRDEHGRIRPRLWEDANRAVSVRGNTVILSLPRPYAFFIDHLGSVPIVSKDWAAKNGDWDGTEPTWRKIDDFKKEDPPFFARANGTGPFQLERWDRQTREIILIRNERYWRPKAALKRVVIRAISEFATRKLMLEAGDADMIYADRSLFSQLQNIPGLEIIDDLPNAGLSNVLFFTYKVNPSGNNYIGSGRLDGDGIPLDFFSDKNVRAGFAAAFDYQRFISDVLGRGTPATGCIPRVVPGHNPQGRSRRLDLKAAEEHFKLAWGGVLWEKGFKLTLAANSGNSMRQAACQILKRNVESLNPKFKVDVRIVEWPTMIDAAKASKLPVYIMGSDGGPDPHELAFYFLYSKGNYPLRQKFADPRFDELIDEAKAEMDPQKRDLLYARLQDLEYDEVPHVVLAESGDFHVQRDWVKGFVARTAFPESSFGGYFYPLSKQ